MLIKNIIYQTIITAENAADKKILSDLWNALPKEYTLDMQEQINERYDEDSLEEKAELSNGIPFGVYFNGSKLWFRGY